MAFVFSPFIQQGMASMSMVGTTGLVCIPTAQVIPNGKMTLGMAYTDAKYSDYIPGYKQIAYFATFGYLPFLEIGLRLTQLPDFMAREAYGSTKDRMVSAKLRVIKESHLIPSLVLGIHDLYGNGIFNAQYLAMSKSMDLPILRLMSIHIGYSSNIIKYNKVKNYSMEGAFAGIEKVFCKYLTAMLEYDTQKYNFGLKISPLGDKIYIDVAILGLDRISGGMNFSFNL